MSQLVAILPPQLIFRIKLRVAEPVVYAVFAKRGERNKNIAVYSEFDFMNGNGNNDVTKK